MRTRWSYARDVHEDLSGRLGEVHIPVTVARGTRDLVVGDARSRLLAAGLAEHRLIRLQGAGHAVHLERPIDVARLLSELSQSDGVLG